MRQLILNIEENRYRLLLQFLKTLDYVRIVHASPLATADGPSKKGTLPDNQLALLRQQLQQLSTPLFQNITDPVTWQKQQRDEWS